MITKEIYKMEDILIKVDGIIFDLKDEELTIINYNNKDDLGKIVIKPSYMHQGKQYPVTAIADIAFKGCGNITEIVLPSSIEDIGERVFDSCEQLRKINIPEGVAILGDYLFTGCKKLKEVSLPQSLKSIGNHTFEYCTSLKGITLPKNLKIIEESAFRGCSSIKTLSIPTTIEIIEKNAFRDCRKLKLTTKLPQSRMDELEPQRFNPDPRPLICNSKK